ncbi:MAG: FAD-dependent oxidoreductase [Candidatus Hydrogenedentes bacterium]|nr:FAD-dependent oxidoreductase [Candidatus Hydrogenedentota bacterium]
MKHLQLFLALACCSCASLHTPAADERVTESYDVVVYGGTSGGVAAAIQAARMGKSVILIEPGRHIGGLSSGGLGATDIGNKGAIGGISREFYQRLGAHYGKPEAWTFEPHVAEDTFKAMLADTGVPVVLNERIDLDGGVIMDGRRIASIRMESGRRFAGRVFIDATYEGDLMAKTGVSYHVGREANAVYGETLNGVQTKNAIYHQFDAPVDPYVKEGDPSSGLLPGIQEGGPGEEGSGDKRVQAYNFRMCLTDDPQNRMPFPKPEGYDPLRYELLLRYLNTGHWTVLKLSTPMPNRKTDTNNKGAFASDNIGMNYEYPDGDYAARERIFNEHKTYQQGLMWFLANDPRVPKHVQDEVNQWGLAKDEFVDSGGWPHQLYVREARRMISDYVMTQHDCQGNRKTEEPVGLAAYTMDSHNVQRYVHEGRVLNEGDVEVGGFPPYPIAYRSIRPKQEECENLLVPVCLSASHIAYGSIRMEPVFMVLGQSAATAACMAIDANSSVQQIDVPRLMERLKQDAQILEWKP